MSSATSSVTNSSPEAVDDDAKLAADLGAQQDREQRDCSGAEECAELTERQHAIVKEAIGKDQSGKADQHEQHACGRLHAAEKLSSKPLRRVGKQQKDRTRRHHRPTLESTARR